MIYILKPRFSRQTNLRYILLKFTLNVNLMTQLGLIKTWYIVIESNDSYLLGG